MFTANQPNAVRQMYTSDSEWNVRQETHERYSVPKIDFAAWGLSCVEWRGSETVLDVGCGPGRWYIALRQHVPGAQYFGLDLYPGMISRHPAPKQLLIGDAQRLPFPDQHFDVVMANHMLFHVRDVEQAIGEFRRVLKPDGILMTTTNSIHNMPELQVLLRRAVTLLVPPGTGQFHVPVPPSDLFTLETGTRQLSRHFYAVVRYDLPSALVFPSVEPVMAYLESTRTIREPQLPEGVAWEEVMMIVREQVNRLLDHFGELVVNKLVGLLVATDRGEFIREYLDHKAKTEEKLG